MAVILIIVVTLPRTQTSLSRARAKEGGKETKGEMYPSHGPLQFITSRSRFLLAIIICYS